MYKKLVNFFLGRFVGSEPISRHELIKRFREHADTSTGVEKAFLLWLLEMPFFQAYRKGEDVMLVD